MEVSVSSEQSANSIIYRSMKLLSTIQYLPTKDSGHDVFGNRDRHTVRVTHNTLWRNTLPLEPFVTASMSHHVSDCDRQLQLPKMSELVTSGSVLARSSYLLLGIWMSLSTVMRCNMRGAIEEVTNTVTRPSISSNSCRSSSFSGSSA